MFAQGMTTREMCRTEAQCKKNKGEQQQAAAPSIDAPAPKAGGDTSDEFGALAGAKDKKGAAAGASKQEASSKASSTCTPAGKDMWITGKELQCCKGTARCTEDRPEEDPMYS